MKLLKLYKNTQIFKIALVIAILVVGYIASVFYNQMKALDASVGLIATSTETQLELEKVLSVLSMYENNLRGYIITKDESYLSKRFLEKGELQRNISKIKLLVSDNPARVADLDRLNKMVDRRFELYHETLLLSKSEVFERERFHAKLKESNNFTQSMKTFIYKTINAEGDKIKFHNVNHQFELEDSIVSAFLLVILSLLILLLSFNKMNVDIVELKKSNDEFRLLNLSFNNAEKIAGFGHWKINGKTGVYSFSDNFYRLLGEEPHAFEPKLSSLLKYIHPDDVDYVVEAHNSWFEKMESTNIMFRYVLADGKIKYIKSIGTFAKNSSGDIIKTGVVYDMTDQYERTLELEESNIELKSINAELESFNNIVSHDLQEPLHKIQMFISRIEGSEFDAVSDKNKTYFSKIKLSASKMQTLLIDLVNYSRTIKGDKVYVDVDLRDTVHRAIDELSSDIEDRNATIKLGTMPRMKAISFQLDQLFINLISNALKYSKDDVVPQINIFTEDIFENVYFGDKLILDEDYHKIVIKDNGIGFKQEYADKIFILFQRLETDPKYTGTGLGLAICKRIIDNHNGFIKAESEPNVGTTFSIFMPKS
ncbi:CHASE3 domain-containing protein [Flavobacterium sp. F-380]|uniref:histidine kinase n=1 Tax=Flavobacterium kayseriense TaxID=2764714 RepID=A0ABR7JAA4_9FLAO|nr:ATP-binding protein [Flavobacterium kayseriense]MBC5842473.1 CHASE3 domain-containing protein [Flavobacterium kayseriense]MBC5849003.1 CHASE3 domain-containing protein [Flavobacterium kayseriense]